MHSKIVTTLWLQDDPLEAVRFWIRALGSGRILRSIPTPASRLHDAPLIVEFALFGRTFRAVHAPHAPAGEGSTSLQVQCDSQQEIDSLWASFVAAGAEEGRGGWLQDRWGVRWQIVPRGFDAMLANPDGEAVTRFLSAVRDMGKLDIAKLSAAWSGTRYPIAS